MKLFSRHRLPTTFTIDDIIWVSSEKEACSLIFSYVEVHWLKLAPGLNEVTGGKTTPQNIFFGPILPNFEENFEIGVGDFERCSMLPVRKTDVPPGGTMKMSKRKPCVVFIRFDHVQEYLKIVDNLPA